MIEVAHTLLAMHDGNVLDWVPDNGSWRLWNYTPVNATDILPGNPLQEGTWKTINAGHVLVPMQDGNVIDWNWTDGSWRLWTYDPKSADIFTGPIAQGQWTKIVPGHFLIPMQNLWYPSVLDWVPADGSWRLWNYDSSSTSDIFPGEPRQQGQWKSIVAGHFLYPMGADGHVLDWVADDGSWRLWRFDPNNAGDVFPGGPVQQGRWSTITGGHYLIPIIGDDHVLDWVFDGTWRLWNYDYGRSDILPGDPVAQGRWETISNIFWRTHQIAFDNDVPVGGWSTLVIRPDGSFDYSGHLHDSGGLSYNVSDGWVVVNNGRAYSFATGGHTAGGPLVPGDSSRRDFNWHSTGTRPELVGNWDPMATTMTYHWSDSANLDINALIEAIKTGIKYVGETISIVAAA